jgi:hypothetical protein
MVAIIPNKRFWARIGKGVLSGGRRGSALVTVAGATFIIAGLTVVLLTVTGNALRSNNRQQLRAAALHVAESGAEMAVLWLRDQPIPPTVDIAPGIGAPPTGTTWNVVVYSDPNNPNQFLKMYRIVATGTVNANSRTVEIVVKQATFGKYAYFTDKETSSGGGAIWWNSKDCIDGPVHSNNTSGTNFNIDYSGWSTNNPRRPIFLDQVTASGSTINYNPSRPRNETDYLKVFANGSKGYQLGIPKINLPPSTTAQKEAAWGGTSGFPSTNGVYLRADDDGGVYIRGDAAVTMSLDGSGNQKMTVVQGSNTTVVTYDINSGTISVTGPVGSGSPTSASSFSNGVIYCTGSITALSGTIADNKVSGGAITRPSTWTIATDTNAGKDITIAGDLVYHTRPDKTLDPDAACNLAAGTLGLVGQEIKIADSGAPNYNHPNREIDAVMLGGSASVDGSISVNNYSVGSVGTLKVIGGLIQSTRGAVGTLSGGVINHGYQKDYHYDPRLAANPPPFYPTTGQYDRLSWRVMPDN